MNTIEDCILYLLYIIIVTIPSAYNFMVNSDLIEITNDIKQKWKLHYKCIFILFTWLTLIVLGYFIINT